MGPTEFGRFRPRCATAPGAGAPVRSRARKGEGEQLRDEILEAAEALLLEKGSPDNVSMRAIADRVGVTPPAIYLHFQDKDELFFQCCNRRFEELSAAMAEAAGTEVSALARLEAMGRAYIEYGLRRPEQYAVLLMGPLPEDITEGEFEQLPGGVALSMTADAVADGIASGELRSDLDPVAAAVTLWALVHGTVMVLLQKRDRPWKLFSDEQIVVEHAIALVRQGVQAEEPSA